MGSYDSLDEVKIDNAWVTVGVFDGVHRGHQEILNRLVKGAHATTCPAVVLTFAPHPAVVLGKKIDFKSLNTPAERAEILHSLGVDIVITQPFDRSLADQTAKEFMLRLKQRLGLKHLVIGYDTALGKGREGNAARLAAIGKELDYSIEVVPPLTDEKGIISSTRIRAAISSGDMKSAAKDLSRPFFVSGPVVHGDGRGHTINLPTANIKVPDGKMIPANGIYAGWGWVEGKRFAAATNVGVRPTFTPDLPTPAIEAYLLDFNKNIYGQELRLEFIQYLRPEEKYETVNALLDQIGKDIKETRKVLG